MFWSWTYSPPTRMLQSSSPIDGGSVLVLRLFFQGCTGQPYAKNALSTKSIELYYHHSSLYCGRDSVADPMMCSASFITVYGLPCVRVRASKIHEFYTLPTEYPSPPSCDTNCYWIFFMLWIVDDQKFAQAQIFCIWFTNWWGRSFFWDEIFFKLLILYKNTLIFF